MERGVIGYTVVPPAQLIRGAAKGKIMPHQRDDPFNQPAVHRMGQYRGDQLRGLRLIGAAAIKTIFINHCLLPSIFLPQEPKKDPLIGLIHVINRNDGL